MNGSIGRHGLIGDLQTAALVSSGGALDWLCWPDFDSEACFASLVGEQRNGCWTLAPRSYRSAKTRYLPGTLVLETTYEQAFGGSAIVTDFMPVRREHSTLVRIVRGIKGRTRMRCWIAPRLDYGNAQPRVECGEPGCWTLTSGPHRMVVRSNAPLEIKAGDLTAEWTVEPGETCAFTMQHGVSYGEPLPPAPDPETLLRHTTEYWRGWSGRNTYTGRYRAEVERSLLTLKALTYEPSGGFVAAPTTSLPEKVGGTRNWDYRFCWLRDSTFSLLGMLECGYREHADGWLQWLSRSMQGNPDGLKILYGITGKREHSEWAAGWLSGYRGSKPVHIGNKASDQLQLDTFGEVLDTLYRARCHGLYPLADRSGEALELPLLENLEKLWSKPDAGLWEFRSGNLQFTQSKVMAWVAFDRGIRMVERFGMKGPVERWRKTRAVIHAEVCKRGFHRGMNSFTQAYGTRHMDASLLLLPLVGFLPVHDERITGTVKAIEKHLLRDGLLLRYDTKKVDDGLPSGEGAFLACSFWLVDVYVLQGRKAEARALFERLLGLANHVGLLSEEYDKKHGLVGNFPQAFSHIALIHAALSLDLGTSVRLHDLE